MSQNAARDVAERLKIFRDRIETTWPRGAVMAMGEIMVKATREELGRQSHAPGTKTPSLPGEPPALITGDLQRSIVATAPVTLGRGRYAVSVGGTTVYARIQEMGGKAGRGSELPARPYLKAAVKRLIETQAFTAVAAKAFMAALRP